MSVTLARTVVSPAVLAALVASAVMGLPVCAGEPEECLVCGKTHSETAYEVVYRERVFPLCSETCLDRYRLAESTGELDSITSRIEPRAALFQQDSNPRPGLSKAYLGLGLLVLAALACGGLSSYIAIEKGLSAPRWFVVGAVLNVFGVLAVILRPPRETTFSARGRSKTPTTHDESVCPDCGQRNHPAAEVCAECHSRLEPAVESEVTRVRRTDP